MAVGSLPHLAWIWKLPLFGLRNQFHQVRSCQCSALFFPPNSNNLCHEEMRTLCSGLTDPVQGTTTWAQPPHPPHTRVSIPPTFIKAFIHVRTTQHTFGPGTAQASEVRVKQMSVLAPRSASPVEHTDRMSALKLQNRFNPNICKAGHRVQIKTLVSDIWMSTSYKSSYRQLNKICSWILS